MTTSAKPYSISFVWNNGGGDDNAFSTGVTLPEAQREVFVTSVKAALGSFASDVSLLDPEAVSTVYLGDIEEILAAALQPDVDEDDLDGSLDGVDPEIDLPELNQLMADLAEAASGDAIRYEMSWVRTAEGSNELYRLHIDLTPDQADILQAFLWKHGPEAWADPQVFIPVPVVQSACDAAAEIIEAAGAYCDFDNAKGLWMTSCQADEVPYWLPDVPHADNPVRGCADYWSVDVVMDKFEREAFVTADEDAAYVHYHEMEAPAGAEVVLLHVCGDVEIEKERRRAVASTGAMPTV